MNAAIYARKSTAEDEETATSDKSITRQVEHAKTYALAKGWTVDERHIYVDDNISGAEFERRPGYVRLLNALPKRGRAPFQVLVMSEGSRLGREMIETAYALKQLHQAGVEVWSYLDDRRRTLDTATDKLLLSVASFADDIEKERAAQRATDTAHRKFAAGHVTGGQPFGYVRARLGPKHVEWRVNEEQAAIVREIFERYARGEGYRTIAWTLNQRKVAAPRAQRGRPSGWEPSTIRSVLDRSIYRGEVVWNKSQKRTTWGEKKQRPRPESQWKRRNAPELRIVSEELAAAVEERRQDRAARYLRSTTGQLIGRPPASTGRYLLSGLLVCPCGGRFEVLKTGNWSNWRFREPVYVCAARRRKGPSVCGNDLALPVGEMDRRVLSVIEADVLSPSFVRYVLGTLAIDTPDDRVELQAERARVAREVENLTKAIANGGDIPVLVTMLRERDKKLKAVDARLEPRAEPNRQQLEHALLRRIDDWRDVLRSNPVQGRMVVQQLFGEIHVHQNEELPSWMATPRSEGLLVGMVHGLASPGSEGHVWTIVREGLIAA